MIEKIKTKGNVTVSRVYKSDFQKEGSLTAELRQEVVTVSKYPTSNMGNSLNDQIFSNDDFGLRTNNYESKETRVAFINVPETVNTVEKVEEKLRDFPNLCLIKTLSNRPILSSEDKNAIEQGFISLNTKANGQIIRYPEQSDRAGQIALTDTGKPQYRRISLSKEEKEDIDLRNDIPNDFYASPEILSEIEGVSIISEEQKIG